MRDISSKQISLRTAKAVAVVTCSEPTLELIKNDALPKGNMLDVARAAGFLAAKQTQHLIPHCHPVSIDGLKITYEYLQPDKEIAALESLQGRFGVVIYGEAKSIGRTGIEMEILTAISISALTIYDLLKPVDKNIEITSVKLLDKTGGKSDRLKYYSKGHKAAVLVCSDSTAAGRREDRSGIVIQEMLQSFNAEIVDYQIVPDEAEAIQKQVLAWVAQDIPFIFTTGGTGLGPRDHTVEAIRAILERDADGITEAMRVHGQMRTPVAMMSRAIAGSIHHTLIVTLPGSSNGARECLEAILPAVFHARNMLQGGGH